MNLYGSLRGLNAYPIPLYVLESIATKRGLDGNADATPSIFLTKEFALASADVYMWLANAPNVAQGGQTYSFSEDQRLAFRNKAGVIYGLYGEDDSAKTTCTYGYKGSRL